MGSDCGSVGRAVASNTRGLRFESSNYYREHLFTVNRFEKTKKQKEAGNGSLKVSTVVFQNSYKRYLGYFCKKICLQGISKIAQTGHTEVVIDGITKMET